MNTIDLEKMKSDLGEEFSKVNQTIAQIWGEHDRSKKELADLESSFPKLLAQHYLGLIPKSELTRAKKRRSELKEFLDDFPLLDAGLQGELKAVNGKIMQLNETER